MELFITTVALVAIFCALGWSAFKIIRSIDDNVFKQVCAQCSNKFEKNKHEQIQKLDEKYGQAVRKLSEDTRDAQGRLVKSAEREVVVAVMRTHLRKTHTCPKCGQKHQTEYWVESENF